MEKKLLFLGGKGGVGKTTIACAIALYLSRQGKKVMLLSADPAHSLRDILEVDFPEGWIKDSIYLKEIDSSRALEEHIERVLRLVGEVMNPDSFREVEKLLKDMKEAPGSEEASLVEELSKVVISNLENFQHIVIDTAPTGHTLWMLKSVGSVGVWLEELIKRRKRSLQLWKASESPKEDKILPILEERRKRFSLFSSLVFSRRTSFIPVLNPDRLSIEETHRLVRKLLDAGIKVETIVINKVLPDKAGDSFLIKRKKQEQLYLKEIENRFRNLKKIEVKLKERDIRGMSMLEELSKELEGVIL